MQLTELVSETEGILKECDLLTATNLSERMWILSSIRSFDTVAFGVEGENRMKGSVMSRRRGEKRT